MTLLRRRHYTALEKAAPRFFTEFRIVGPHCAQMMQIEFMALSLGLRNHGKIARYISSAEVARLASEGDSSIFKEVGYTEKCLHL